MAASEQVPLPRHQERRYLVKGSGEHAKTVSFIYDHRLAQSPAQLDRSFWLPTYDPAAPKPFSERSPAGGYQALARQYRRATEEDNMALHFYRNVSPAPKVVDRITFGTNIRMVIGGAKAQARRRNLRVDDAFAAAVVAFDKACEKYDPRRGSFSTVFSNWLNSATSKLAKEEMRRKRKPIVYLYESIMDDDGLSFADTVAAPVDYIGAADELLAPAATIFAAKHMPTASPRTVSIMRGVSHGLTQHEIASGLGVSESTVKHTMQTVRKAVSPSPARRTG